MDCRAFRKLMYLREDELDAELRVEFHSHRSTCGDCASEYRAMQKAMNTIVGLGREIPEGLRTAALEDSVLGEIEGKAASKKAVGMWEGFDVFVAWLGTPKVRVAIALTLAVMVSSFGVEYTSGYADISAMERSIDRSSPAQAELPETWLLGNEGAAAVSALLEASVGKGALRGAMNEEPGLRDSSSPQLIQIYESVQSLARRLPPSAFAGHPEFWTLLRARDNPRDLDTLLRKRTILLREIYNFIPEGRRTP